MAKLKREWNVGMSRSPLGPKIIGESIDTYVHVYNH